MSETTSPTYRVDRFETNLVYVLDDGDEHGDFFGLVFSPDDASKLVDLLNGELAVPAGTAMRAEVRQQYDVWVNDKRMGVFPFDAELVAGALNRAGAAARKAGAGS